ncbi:hypothetical protein [Stygiolobus caldivivus]|uniref:Uncharacterized protein n=1 Tax=Stygiolobus caldivivus TaxID=2824673 RepID=A0A8D5ZKK0_9CREN|nr:hypothetical protein [Stygiolobus caldivivus]BCU71357.1 hypothetical protein KN1_26540 [Stygiolobus caldivivus]
MDVIGKILEKPRLIRSYYYSVNLVIIINAAQRIYSQGKKPCIINFDKIKWEFYPYDINFKQICEEESENLVFEAEKVSEIPIRFRLITSVKNFNLGCEVNTIEKIGNNLYKLRLTDDTIIFHVKDGKLIERVLNPLEEEILRLLNENNGRMSMKEVVDITSYKLGISKESVRNELAFLRSLGKIEIDKGTVLLIR